MRSGRYGGTEAEVGIPDEWMVEFRADGWHGAGRLTQSEARFFATMQKGCGFPVRISGMRISGADFRASGLRPSPAHRLRLVAILISI